MLTIHIRNVIISIIDFKISILIETSLHILMLHRSGSEAKANTLLLREQRKVLKGR